MSYRQITQAEAIERALTGHCFDIKGSDGVTRHYHPPARLWWKDAADMPSTPQPAGWKAGHPGQPA